MHDLLQAVEKSIAERKAFQPGEPILVAVSGGLDSMVLLHLLVSLAPAYRWKLAVAHFNHQLRGRSSAADERLVRRAAQDLKLRIVVGRGNVRAFAERHGLSIEMAARQLRHEFLALAARRQRIRKLVLAHHADDQVELFFLRLLRGAGSEGLAGMNVMAPSPADSQLQLVRPLLDFPKRALADFARRHRVDFREDASNATLDLLRNRIRRELLPLLKRRYQPAVDLAVLRAMNILGSEAGFIIHQADQWLGATNPPPFAQLPVAVQRRVVLHELQHLELPADFDTVEMLRRWPDRRVNLGPGLGVSRSPHGLLRVHWQRPMEFRADQQLVNLNRAAGRTRFGDVEFAWRRVRARGEDLPKPRSGGEVFDADLVGSPIKLRRWQPGDRFQPIGMTTAVKLQNLFTNQKIAAGRRRELVVAETATGRLFWVEGLRIGEAAKVRVTTKSRLIWRWWRGATNQRAGDF